MFSGTQHKWLVLVAIAALAAFVIACGTDETKLVSDNPSGGVGAQPTVPADENPTDGDQDQLPTDPGYKVVDALAPIESVQLLVLESYPEQFVVQVISGLPSGCATFSHTEVSQDGTDIKISVYNSVPDPDELAAIACAAIYGIHDENVSLGSDFERGTTYSVYVNEQEPVTFTTGSAPLQSLPPAEDVDYIVEPAPVEGLKIIISEDSRGPVNYYAHVLWGLKNGCMKSLEPNLVRSGENEFTIYPLAKAPTGDVACTDDYRVDSAQVDLGVVGEGLVSCAAYTVIYGEEKVEFQAIAPNVRCADPNAPTPTPAPPASIIADSLALELSLKANGADVENGGQSGDSSFFNIAPSVLKVNGFRVEVFEFAPGDAAADAAARVSSDGTYIKTVDGAITSLMWIAPPRWYTFGNAIVLYVGLDEEVISHLDAVATQFAGDGAEDQVGELEPVDSEFTSQLATIEKVSLASTRSIPAQHLVGVTIMLSNGCEEFKSIDYKVDGRQVHIEVLTQVPTAPTPCTLAIMYEDHSINIGSEYEAGVEYDVIVNGEAQGTFIGG